MRRPSVAVPHSMPPSEAPGPTGVLQTMSPLSGLSAQKMPLFWPKPTILPSRLGPDPPRSKSGLVGTGQFGFVPVGRMHATVQVSKPCSLVAHLICPVFKSSANAVSKKSRSEEHTSELQSHSDLVCRLLLEKKNKQ